MYQYILFLKLSVVFKYLFKLMKIKKCKRSWWSRKIPVLSVSVFVPARLENPQCGWWISLTFSPWRFLEGGYPADIRPPEIGFCRQILDFVLRFSFGAMSPCCPRGNSHFSANWPLERWTFSVGKYHLKFDQRWEFIK